MLGSSSVYHLTLYRIRSVGMIYSMSSLLYLSTGLYVKYRSGNLLRQPRLKLAVATLDRRIVINSWPSFPKTIKGFFALIMFQGLLSAVSPQHHVRAMQWMLATDIMLRRFLDTDIKVLAKPRQDSFTSILQILGMVAGPALLSLQPCCYVSAR